MIRAWTLATAALVCSVVACGPQPPTSEPGNTFETPAASETPGAPGGEQTPSQPDVEAPTFTIPGKPSANTPEDVPRRWPALQETVPRYGLQIAASDLQALEDNIHYRGFSVPGTFTFDGKTWPVTVRYRGRHTRYLPKKSFQVRFPKEDKFHGNVSQLELLAEWKDGGMLTEKLWYDLAAAAGVRAPRASYAMLDLNGKTYGLMLQVEAVKKAFLRAHAFDDDSDIYRCGQYDCELRDPPKETYQEDWAKRTNESEPMDGLFAFLDALNRTSPAAFRTYVQEKFALDEYLAWLAVDAAISNDTIGDSRSFVIYDPLQKRWAYVPWDLNNAVSLMNRLNGWPQWPNTTRKLKNFSVYDPGAYELAEYRANDPYLPGVKPAWSTLNTRILDDALLRDQQIAHLEWLLAERFREDVIGARAEQIAALIAPFLDEDPFIDAQLASNSVQYMKDYVKTRRAYLQKHLEGLRTHGASRLLVHAVGRDSNGAAYVELHNTTSTPQSVAGLWVTGWLRTPKQANPAAGTSIAPGATLRLGANALPGFQLDPAKVEVGLFEADGRVALDTIFLPTLSAGEAWQRESPGSEHWVKAAASN